MKEVVVVWNNSTYCCKTGVIIYELQLQNSNEICVRQARFRIVSFHHRKFLLALIGAFHHWYYIIVFWPLVPFKIPNKLVLLKVGYTNTYVFIYSYSYLLLYLFRLWLIWNFNDSSLYVSRILIDVDKRKTRGGKSDSFCPTPPIFFYKFVAVSKAD